MKPRTVLILAVVAILALALALALSGSRRPETTPQVSGKLWPGLAEKLDTVTKVRIGGAGGETLATLEKGDNGWGMAEKHGYRVDVAKLRDLLDALANAKLVEAKTSNPNLHSRLGVEDLDDGNARGALVEITAPDAVRAVIVGDNVGQGNGTYVRRVDEAQSWLIGNDIAVEKKAPEWLDKSIIDIAARDVTKVEVVPAKGAKIVIERVEDDTASDFKLLDVPKGREPAEGYTRDALAGVLSMLRFEDVFTAESEPVPGEGVQRAVFTIADGRSVQLESWDKDGKLMGRLTMTLDEDAARAKLEQRKAVAEVTADADEPADAIDVDAELAKLRESVEAFGRDRNNWVYVIPGYKASNLRKGFDEYLKPKD